jgi:hypothetical protein
MNRTRFVSLVAASLITATQWTIFIWLLSPAPVEAAPILKAAVQVLPEILVIAHRTR